jgi:hypothetical protein
MMTEHSNSIMGVMMATSPNRRTDDVQLRRRGMSLNVGNPPPQNASSVVPKCHKKSRVIARLRVYCGELDAVRFSEPLDDEKWIQRTAKSIERSF